MSQRSEESKTSVLKFSAVKVTTASVGSYMHNVRDNNKVKIYTFII